MIGNLEDKLKIDFHDTNPNGKITLEPIYCLGNCACAPAVMIDGVPKAKMCVARMNEIVDELRIKHED